MKKETYLIAAHPIQRAILELAAGEGIDNLSLRKIGAKIGLTQAQQVKFHLGQMVRYGFLDIIGGKYRPGRILEKS